jgi:hypothetical protein
METGSAGFSAFFVNMFENSWKWLKMGKWTQRTQQDATRQ